MKALEFFKQLVYDFDECTLKALAVKLLTAEEHCKFNKQHYYNEILIDLHCGEYEEQFDKSYKSSNIMLSHNDGEQYVNCYGWLDNDLMKAESLSVCKDIRKFVKSKQCEFYPLIVHLRFAH
jgi:hypothetical protein